jgi:uncharacterized membrane protein YphA (DoxX/SURF4 family)
MGLFSCIDRNAWRFPANYRFSIQARSFFLLINLIVAAATHFGQGDGLGGAAHAIELAFVFAGLIFVGPGKYSVDKK